MITETVFLLLFFLFVFLGIEAFSTGSTFGSVINSLLPVTGGMVLTTAKDEDYDKILASVQEVMQKVMTILS